MSEVVAAIRRRRFVFLSIVDTYIWITAYLGFEVNEGEYKVMGLAPYGTPRYADQLRSLANGQPDQAGPLQQYVQEAQDRVIAARDALLI